MRHITNIIITIFILSFTVPASFSAIKGGLEYSIPVDYSQMNEQELSEKAEFFYTKASSSATVNDDVTAALTLYNALSGKNPENIIYTLRLGKLYDNIGKDRYAKGCYFKAASVAPQKPEPYFYLGEYFFSRQQYRRALKYYKKAYSCGYKTHPQTITRLKEIYIKLGDTKSLENL